MIKEDNYPNFTYFIECYFNWSMDYSDLEKLIEEFLMRENSEFVERLKSEISVLYKLNDPQKIKELVYEYGNRNLTLEKSKKMLDKFFSMISNT